MGIQAAEALHHAHELGVVHRDVKPGNLLVDGRGNLWVTDFGLAQIHGDNQLTLSGDAGHAPLHESRAGAALAGCGQGKDAANRQPQELSRFRVQALAWLRADLDAWRLRFKHEPRKAAGQVLQTMLHWQHDTDFNGVRGKTARAKLPEAERQGWQNFWGEVEELRKRATDPK